MLLTLHISKIEPGNYRVLVLDGREELDQWGAPNIGAAIRQCSQAEMPDLSGFHIWYEHVCVGTTTMSNMRIDPEGIAQRLMALHGQFHGQKQLNPWEACSAKIQYKPRGMPEIFPWIAIKAACVLECAED